MYLVSIPYAVQKYTGKAVALLHRISVVILEKQTLRYIICNFQQKNLQNDNDVLQTTMPAILSGKTNPSRRKSEPSPDCAEHFFETFSSTL